MVTQVFLRECQERELFVQDEKCPDTELFDDSNERSLINMITV